eukprot:947753-Amphidinium_carterae.1
MQVHSTTLYSTSCSFVSSPVARKPDTPGISLGVMTLHIVSAAFLDLSVHTASGHCTLYTHKDIARGKTQWTLSLSHRVR